jgi:hypothetical protein
MYKVFFFAMLMFSLISCEKAFEYEIKDIPPFEALAKPNVGSGYQVHVPPFPVPNDFEREWFMRLPIGNTEEIYVTGVEMKMRPGTHHFIAYPFTDENAPNLPTVGVIREQNLPSGKLNFRSRNAMENFLLEATAPNYRIDIPAGYAIPFKGGTTLDCNSHYFNKTNGTLFGEIYMNLYTKPKSEIKGLLTSITLENHEILILPPKQRTVITSDHIFEEDSKLVVLTSHSHRRGEKFEIYRIGGPEDGKLIYTSTDYIHPLVNYYDEPLIFKKGEGLRSVVTYNNQDNRTISSGVTSEDEMGIIFGYVAK